MKTRFIYRVLLTLSLLLPLKAEAIELPSGCYVADYYRLDPCWAPADNYAQWQDYSNGPAYYGSTVNAIIQYGFEQKANASSLGYELSAANNDYNVLVADYNLLLKRLGRAKKICGKKCKKA